MSHEPYRTGMESPRGVWWKPVHKWEKRWIAIGFAWCIVLFAMMPLWHVFGGQNPTGARGTVTPEGFRDRAEQFISDHQVGEMEGIPVVEPPPGSDVYLMGMMWRWTPVLRLEKGREYKLHVSSVDINHGINIHPVNINLQIVPGYDYALRVVPREAGEFPLVCNEYCGVGHHLMVGKIIVEDPDAPMADADVRTGEREEGHGHGAGHPGPASLEPNIPRTALHAAMGGER